MDNKFEKYLIESFKNENIFAKPNVRKPKLFKSTTAVFTSLAMLTATLLGLPGCNKKKNKNEVPEEETTTSVVGDIKLDKSDLRFVSLSDLGAEQRWVKNSKSIYSNPTGNVDIGSIVVGSNGKLYASQEDAERAKNLGTTIDTKGGTLTVVEENGKTVVYDNSGSNTYIERDPSTGSETMKSGTPEGTSSSNGGTYEKAGYIEAPYSLYDSQGNEVVVKGQTMEESEWNEAVKKYSKTKPTTPAPTVKEEVVEEKTLSDEEIQRQIEEEMSKRGYSQDSYVNDGSKTEEPTTSEESTREVEQRIYPPVTEETTREAEQRIYPPVTEENTTEPVITYDGDFDDSQNWGIVDGELVIVNPDDVYQEEEGYQYTKTR